MQSRMPVTFAEFSRTWLPGSGRNGRAWNALLGAGGGDLRSAVVTRLDLDTVRALHVVPFPDLPEQTIRVAAAISRPIFPFVAFIGSAVKLLNAFPEALAAEVPADHATLRAIFDFEPTTLDDEAHRRKAADRGEGNRACYAPDGGADETSNDRRGS